MNIPGTSQRYLHLSTIEHWVPIISVARAESGDAGLREVVGVS
jgi:hypothetical protein